jgi:serine/threonine protein kinase
MLTVKYDDKIVLGTADYVAPEQIANSHKVDVRADVYALGATLYFLLAGHPPFPTGTVSQKLLWHRTKEPTAVCQVRPAVPAGLGDVVARMMAKDPYARPQTPADVVAALAPWQPAEVPLPAEAEMPKLSPAAVEALRSTAGEQSGPRPAAADRVAAGSGSLQPTSSGSVRVPDPGPFAPARATDNVFGPTPVPSRLANFAPFVANAQPEVQTLDNNVGRPTPVHTGPIYRRPLPSRADTEPPPQRAEHTYALLGLVATAVLVTVGVAAFLLFGL